MSQIRALLGAVTSSYEGVELAWSPGTVTARFRSGRSQAVTYKLNGELVRFQSTVLKPAAARALDQEKLAADLLERNRDTELVAFGFSSGGHVEAWIDQRASTLQADELRFYLVALAVEADRLEYLLTGKDVS